jgi:hypothetical protein
MLGAFAAVFASCAGASAAPATTASGTAVRWMRQEVTLQPVVPSAASGVSSAELSSALREGARVWNDALGACGVPRLQIGSARTEPVRVVEDGANVVVIRTGSWCPERALDPEDCYDPQRAGLTHLYPRLVPGDSRDGELREADLEINAVDFRWSLDGTRPGTRSLRALVVHELGHVLGLDHEHPGAPGYRESIMYPSPVEGGRPVVLKPGPAEVASLCEMHANGSQGPSRESAPPP